MRFLFVSALSAVYLTIFCGWFAGCTQKPHDPLRGVWIRVADKSYQPETDTLPVGLRFFRPDSVEVYSANSYFQPFSRIELKDGVLTIPTSKGNWTTTLLPHRDTIRLVSQRDTVGYVRALINPMPPKDVHAERIVISSGSPWGTLVDAVIYPQGKVAYLERNSSSFQITHCELLDKRTVESFAVIAEVLQSEAFKEFRRSSLHYCIDGEYLDVAVANADTIISFNISELCGRGSHPLTRAGYYTLNIALHTNQGRLDSTRVRRLPYFYHRGVSIARMVLMIESLNGQNVIPWRDAPKVFDATFDLETIDKVPTTIFVKGNIVKLRRSSDSSLYRVSFPAGQVFDSVDN